MEALERERAEFGKAKQQLDAEFNQKRAKFKELYLAKEGNSASLSSRLPQRDDNSDEKSGKLLWFHPSPEDLKRQTSALESAQAQLSAAQAQLTQARSEVETIKTVATVSENTKQEAIDQVRGQWQEEVASLQAIMKGTLRPPNPPSTL